MGQGRVASVSATIEYVEEGAAAFDRLAALNLVTETGFTGRVIQDVVTRPPRKWARIQGREGFVEWHNALRPGEEAALVGNNEGAVEEKPFAKTRPDDFIRELSHIETALREGTEADSPIALERALDTMLVIAAAHRSARAGATQRIDYAAGYGEQALS